MATAASPVGRYADVVRPKETRGKKGNFKGMKKLKRSKCMYLRFKEPKARDLLWDFVKEALDITLDFVDGMVELPNGGVDVTFTSRTYATQANDTLWAKKNDVDSDDELPYHRLYEPEKTAVFVHWVPIPMEDSDIVGYFSTNHGQVYDLMALRDKKGIKNGIKRFHMKREDLENNPTKSYVTVEGYTFYVKYFNQVRTCKKCEQPGHIKKDCPSSLTPSSDGEARDPSPAEAASRESDAQKRGRITNKMNGDLSMAATGITQQEEHHHQTSHANDNTDKSEAKQVDATSGGSTTTKATTSGLSKGDYDWFMMQPTTSTSISPECNFSETGEELDRHSIYPTLNQLNYTEETAADQSSEKSKPMMDFDNYHSNTSERSDRESDEDSNAETVILSTEEVMQQFSDLDHSDEDADGTLVHENEEAVEETDSQRTQSESEDDAKAVLTVMVEVHAEPGAEQPSGHEPPITSTHQVLSPVAVPLKGNVELHGEDAGIPLVTPPEGEHDSRKIAGGKMTRRKKDNKGSLSKILKETKKTTASASGSAGAIQNTSPQERTQQQQIQKLEAPK